VIRAAALYRRDRKRTWVAEVLRVHPQRIARLTMRFTGLTMLELGRMSIEAVLRRLEHIHGLAPLASEATKLVKDRQNAS
jgi:hypothetical protein